MLRTFVALLAVAVCASATASTQYPYQLEFSSTLSQFGRGGMCTDEFCAVAAQSSTGAGELVLYAPDLGGDLRPVHNMEEDLSWSQAGVADTGYGAVVQHLGEVPTATGSDSVLAVSAPLAYPAATPTDQGFGALFLYQKPVGAWVTEFRLTQVIFGPPQLFNTTITVGQLGFIANGVVFQAEAGSTHTSPPIGVAPGFEVFPEGHVCAGLALASVAGEDPRFACGGSVFADINPQPELQGATITTAHCTFAPGFLQFSCLTSFLDAAAAPSYAVVSYHSTFSADEFRVESLAVSPVAYTPPSPGLPFPPFFLMSGDCFVAFGSGFDGVPMVVVCPNAGGDGFEVARTETGGTAAYVVLDTTPDSIIAYREPWQGAEFGTTLQIDQTDTGAILLESSMPSGFWDTMPPDFKRTDTRQGGLYMGAPLAINPDGSVRGAMLIRANMDVADPGGASQDYCQEGRYTTSRFFPPSCFGDVFCDSALHGDCSWTQVAAGGTRYYCRTPDATEGMEVATLGPCAEP